MSWLHFRDRQVKARKPHDCALCGLVIQVGENYVRKFRWGGRTADDVRAHAFHPRCIERTEGWTDRDWAQL